MPIDQRPSGRLGRPPERECAGQTPEQLPTPPKPADEGFAQKMSEPKSITEFSGRSERPGEEVNPTRQPVSEGLERLFPHANRPLVDHRPLENRLVRRRQAPLGSRSLDQVGTLPQRHDQGLLASPGGDPGVMAGP